MMAAANHTRIDCHHVLGFHSVDRFDGGQYVAEQREAGDERQQVKRIRTVHRAESIQCRAHVSPP